MRKIEEGVKRQIDVDRIFEEILQDQVFLRKNAKELKSFDATRKAIEIKNLGNEKLTMSQIITLRNLLVREVLRNRAIDAGIILGEKSNHFENGNKISVLALLANNKDKVDRAKSPKITDQIELLNELNTIVETNPVAKELSDKIMTFFSRLYPLINERYSEINGQPLQSEGLEMQEAIANDESISESLLEGMPENINANMLNRIYIPIYVGESGYFRDKKISLKSILDLGVNDGFTESLGPSNAIVKVDSIINVMYKYKKEARNYWGLHQIIQSWNSLINEQLKITPMQKAEGQKQAVNMQEYISQQAISYVEDLMRDLAGYKVGITSSALQFLRKNFYRAVLAGNFKVVLTQLTTMYNLAVLYGDNFATFFPKMYKNLFAQLTPEQRAKVQELKQRNNIYYDRTFAPTYDIGEAQTEGTNFINKAINFLMSGIALTDTAVNNALYLTLLETQNKETGMNYTKQEADAILNKGILRSQSSALDLGKAPILRTQNDILKSLLKFMGEPLKLQSQIYSSKKQLELISKLNKTKNGKTNEQIIKEELLEKEAQAITNVQEERRKLDRLQEKEDSESFATLENDEQKKIRDDIAEQKDIVSEAEALAEDTTTYVRTSIEALAKTIASKPKAQEMMTRRIAALMGTMIYMAALNTVWYAILRDLGNLDDREQDEELFAYLTRKFSTNLIGEFFQLFPFIRDIYGLIENNYDFASIDEIVLLQDTTELVLQYTRKLVNGEEISFPEALRDFTVYGGRAFGLPAKNLENVFVLGLMTLGGESGKAFYYDYRVATGQRVASNKELKQAIAEGNEEMIQTIVESKIAARNVSVSRPSLEEFIRINRLGIDINIPGLKDSYTIDGVEYTMDAKQRSEFRSIYNQADLVVQKMILSPFYRRLGDKKKASLIQSIYNYYLRLAKTKVFDVDLVPDNRMFRSLNQAFRYFRDVIGERLFREQQEERRKRR
jgi:hypothetical protein